MKLNNVGKSSIKKILRKTLKERIRKKSKTTDFFLFSAPLFK